MPAVRLAVFFLAGVALAAEYRGRVTSQGLPIPGASVTLRQGEASWATVTGEDGSFCVSGLPEGQFTLEIRMFGFVPLQKSISIPSEPAQWELTLAAPAAQPGQALVRRAPAGATTQPQASAGVLETEPPTEPTPADLQSLERDANEAFLLSGSLSQGVSLASRQPFLFGFPGAPGELAPGQVPGGRVPFEGQGSGMEGEWGGFGGVFGPGMAGGPGLGGPRGGPGFGPPGPPGAGGGWPGSRGPLQSRQAPMARGRPEWMSRRGVGVFGNRQRGGRPVIQGRASFSLNNSALDAKPYSLSGQEIPKPSYARARYSLGLGGALRIPKLLERPGGFFFLNYSGTRSRSGFDRITTVPSVLERSGDFSASIARGPVRIYDLLSGAPFPGNRLPASRMNPAALGLLEFIPLPNLPGRVQNYQLVTSVPDNSDRFGLRLGYSLTRTDRLSGAINLDRRSRTQVQLFGFRDQSKGGGVDADLNWVKTFRSTVINNLSLRFNRNRSDLIPYFAYGRDVAGELGIQGTPRDPIAYGPPNLNFTNFGDLTDGNPSLGRNNTWTVTEGLTLIRGSHTLRFGVQHQRVQRNLLTYSNARGTYLFGGLLTSALDAHGQPLPGTGFDFADFLLGYPQSSTIRWGHPDIYFRSTGWNAYFVEDWRARPGLSLNLGVRYEYTAPFYEKYDRLANLDIAPGFTAVAVVTPGVAGPFTGVFPRSLVEPDRNNLAPRLGLAWRPRARDSLVIRLGYGIYYNGAAYGSIASRLAQQPPFALTSTFVTSLREPLTLETGFLGRPGVGIRNTYAIARNYRVGYAQAWNFSLQRELPWSLVLELSYLGTKGTSLDVLRSPNQAPPGSPLDAEQRRPIPDAVAFLYDSSDGHSIYHSGRLRLVRRFRRNFSFSTSYVWGKSIDNVSSYGGGLGVVALDPFDLRRERGLSSFDHRHTWDASFVWEPPFGEGPGRWLIHGWAGKLLERWRLSGSLRFNSGAPFTAQVMGNRADSGGTGVTGNGRADATGLPVKSGKGYFNLAAFAVPPPGRYGNAGRNTIPGPHFFVTNLSLGRSFPLRSERRELELRVEAENALNSVNITRIGTTVNASNYGLATAAGPMRRVSVELRLRF